MPRNDSPFSRPAAAKASAGIVTWCFEVIVVQPRGRTLTDLLISITVEGLHLIRKAVVAPNSIGFRDKLCSSAPQPSLGDFCRKGSRGHHGAKTAKGIVTPTNELSSIGGYSPTSKRYSPGSMLSMVNSKVPQASSQSVAVRPHLLPVPGLNVCGPVTVAVAGVPSACWI